MKSFGSLFVNTIKLKHPVLPLFEWGWTQETDRPYRKSKTCLVFWIPFVPLAIAVGTWGEPQDINAVYEAMGVRKVAEFGDLPVGTKGEDVSKW